MTELDDIMDTVQSSQRVMAAAPAYNAGDTAAWIFQKLGTPTEGLKLRSIGHVENIPIMQF